MADKLKIYPTGSIAMGNGNLLQVTNVRHMVKTAGSKIIHTIQQAARGVFRGPEESELSFDAVVDEDGYERDYLKMVKNGTIRQLRLKVPGETIAFEGMAHERSQEFAVDNAIKYAIAMIGKSEPT